MGNAPEFTPQQLKAIEAYAALADSRTQDEIAEEVGVTRKTLWEWRKEPQFNAAVKEAGRRNIISEFGPILQAMKSKALKGDVQAAKLLLETAGLTSQQRDLNINVGEGYKNIVADSMEIAQKISEEDFAGVR